jgi:hypothetical protein
MASSNLVSATTALLVRDLRARLGEGGLLLGNVAD